MQQYHIHHSTEIGLRFTEEEVQPRIYVGFVEAESVADAFKKTQNLGESNWNPNNPQRSTSVGDVIQSNDGFFLVKGVGFKHLF
jgi:hypothetical protein